MNKLIIAITGLLASYTANATCMITDCSKVPTAHQNSIYHNGHVTMKVECVAPNGTPSVGKDKAEDSCVDGVNTEYTCNGGPGNWTLGKTTTRCECSADKKKCEKSRAKGASTS